jgi:hypothetical protein
METRGDNGRCEEWGLYDDPTILRVSASAPEGGWITLTLETDTEEVQPIGVAGEPLSCQDFAADGSTDLASLMLILKLEEIPHLVAILNEIYLRHHANAITSLEFEPDPEFPPRRSLPSGETIRWPIGSRLDQKETLRAGKIVAPF